MKAFRLEQEGVPGKGCSGKGQAVISLVSRFERECDDEWLTHPHTSWDTLEQDRGTLKAGIYHMKPSSLPPALFSAGGKRVSPPQV